jgi:hypothetical protein
MPHAALSSRKSRGRPSGPQDALMRCCYDAPMRTTLTIDDQIAKDLKELAHRTGKPLKDVVNDTLRRGLQRKRAPRAPKSFRLKTVSLGGVLVGLNLDKALSIADAFEDEEIARKLARRK